MQDLEWDYNDTDIERFNKEYLAISQIIEQIEETYEVIEEVKIEPIYIKNNIYSLPKKDSQIPIINTRAEQSDTSNVISLKKKQERIEAIQKKVFKTNWEILSNITFESEIKKIAKIVSDDPVIANLYYLDCIAANDEKFPDRELSDYMIIRAIKTAKVRKDGAFVQSIKNNLIYQAQKLEKQSLSNTEKSLLLADHIKNLTPENPITINTVKYGICQIISIETSMKGDDASYDIEIITNTWEKKHIQLLASVCTVWDLSNDVIIRSIQSTIQSKKTEYTNIKERTSAFIKKWWNGIKNIFKKNN